MQSRKATHIGGTMMFKIQWSNTMVSVWTLPSLTGVVGQKWWERCMGKDDGTSQCISMTENKVSKACNAGLLHGEEVTRCTFGNSIRGSVKFNSNARTKILTESQWYIAANIDTLFEMIKWVEIEFNCVMI